MADPNSTAFPLFLRPSVAKKDNEGSLQRQIQEIVSTKGHLRTVTETSLDADIVADDAGIKVEAQPSIEDEDVDAGDERGTIEHLTKVKQQMVAIIGDAHNTAMLTVDFVSLLLSKYNTQGKSSMSDGLKQSISPGTLAYDQLDIGEPTNVEKSTDELVAQGQRLKGLTAAADNLLSAAGRLEKEVRKETTYWKEVLSVADAGWSVCRVSRNSEMLGVQLGFAEAGPLFRNQGFTVLNSNDDGSLYLHQRVANRQKMIRIRIAQNGKIVGTARLRSELRGERGIEEDISRARDSLFDEELFHEMNIEAQSLTSYGVRWRDSTVHIPMVSQSRDTEILVDLISREDADNTTSPERFVETAQCIATIFKVLMLHTYRQRLLRRSAPPPPITERRRGGPVATIIRPLLNQDIHSAAVRSTRDYLSKLQQLFSRANISFSPSISTPSISSVQNSAGDLIEYLARRCVSTVTVPLPSSVGELKVELRTSLPFTDEEKPGFRPQDRQADQTSTECKLLLPRAAVSLMGLTASMESSKAKVLQRTFYSMQELLSYVDNILALDIAHNVIASMDNMWTATEQDAEVTAPATGGERKATTRFIVSCGSASLRLRWKRDGKGPSGSVEWTREKGDEALREVVQRVMS
ncbi:hypothetical protein NA57DRAFT_57890 [Rhizodiscina lignyota]|uniref:Mediator of RNA polymerase II transcription subunit 17 n=1 Tax=Rhizodiscina lignyota TaxID=1504668 RepID=A0A9P4IDE6_9PEZI|nr:hypothetical protein NA57DRAFT_57890 [Rhizodiscina lignyota]